MKNSLTSLVMLCLLAAGSFVFAQTAEQPANYADPDAGEAGNPYMIATWQNLYWLSQNDDYWGAHFIQTANIDLGAATPGIEEWDDSRGWTSIGRICDEGNDRPFSGVYDGGGHSISGLFIDRPDFFISPLQREDEFPEEPCPTSSAGLFGLVEDAEIRNLSLPDVDITGGFGVGPLAVVIVDSEIENVSASGSASGFFAVGGLIGLAVLSEISDVSSSVNVSALIVSGGLLGQALGSSINGSSATGTVTGSGGDGGIIIGPRPLQIANDAFKGIDPRIGSSARANTREGGFAGGSLGGFVGSAEDSEITKSFSTGNVQGGSSIGGFAGDAFMNTIIRESFSTSDVEGVFYVGGFVGFLEDSEILDSYHQGKVEGDEYVGGFAGAYSGSASIRFAYSSGEVSGNIAFNGFFGGEMTDGFIQGNGGGVVENSFWDVDTDGIPGTQSGDVNEGAIGRSTSEMQDIFTFQSGDWDIQPDPNVLPGYPLLTWQLDTNSPIWTVGSSDPVAVPIPGWSVLLSFLLVGLGVAVFAIKSVR